MKCIRIYYDLRYVIAVSHGNIMIVVGCSIIYLSDVIHLIIISNTSVIIQRL